MTKHHLQVSNWTLYNVGADRFLNKTSGNPTAMVYGEKIYIHQVGDGLQIIYARDNLLFFAQSNITTTAAKGTKWYDCFSITAVDSVSNGYVIQKVQKNATYVDGQYIGYDGSSDNRISPNMTGGNIVWQFIDADLVENAMNHYPLYLALESATGYESVITDYEAIYANETSTWEELNAATAALNKSLLMSRNYQAPFWNEQPILFYTADGSFGQNYTYTWALPNNSYTSGGYFYKRINGGESSSISATVLVEEPSTLVYGLNGYNDWIRVSIDGTEVRALHNVQHHTYPSDKTHTRFFEELEPGLHTITWTCSAYGSYGYYYLYDVSVMSKPQITVSLLEPGSLGTEVLYNTDHIKNVRRLKVKGAMNSDDWGRIKMMSTLLELDLSEAQFTEIPANQFKVSYSDTTMNFLHKVVLPEGLTTIVDEAFYDSFVEDINLPSTMKRVGKYAQICIYHSSKLQQKCWLIMDD